MSIEKKIFHIRKRLAWLEDEKTIREWPITQVHERIAEVEKLRKALNRREKSVSKAKGEPVANISLHDKTRFLAVLEALQQYVDNGRDAAESVEGQRLDDLRAKIGAAASIRDRLEAILASTAE